MLFFGVKVSTKNSLAPYLSFISFRYFKSGSPSIRSVSDDASSLKFLLKYPKKQRHGPTGNIMLEFEAMFTKFKDIQNN